MAIDKLLKEALVTVTVINDDLYENSLDNNTDETDVTVFLHEHGPILSLEYAGTQGYLIKFFDLTIWFSEEDDREYTNEKMEEYEPLEDFVRRKVNFMLTSMSELRVMES